MKSDKNMSYNTILNLIPWTIAVLSLLGIVIIVLRKIPLLLKLPPKPQEGQTQPFLGKILLQKIVLRIRGLKYSSYLALFSKWLEKTLRKIRVLILKIDNIFVSLIGKSREKSQIWTVRSRAWMEQHRLKKIQKLQVLEKLDQAEIIETIQKAKEEVREEEANGKKVEETAPKKEELSEEKNCIDMIAKDPRNVDAYKRLGFLYCEQGNKDDAKNCFKQVLKLNPDDLEVISKMRELAE